MIYMATPNVTRVNIDRNDPSFLEQLVINKSPLTPIAKKLLAIENASEDAKNIIQKDGVFERIIADLGHGSFTGEFENGKRITYTNNRKVSKKVEPRNPSSKELAHISIIVPDGGHYSSGVVNPTNKTVKIFDSMCSSIGEHDQYKSMTNVYKKAYPGYKISLTNSNSFYQPSGGFCLAKPQLKSAVQKTFARFPHEKLDGVNWDKMYEVSEFDVMSQHHFCYVEAIVFLAKEILGTKLGPRGSSNMSERLVFIKSVLWGLLQKYCFTPAFKETKKYENLKHNFQFYVDVQGAEVRHGFTIPGPNVKYVVRKFTLPTVTKNTPLRDVINPPDIVEPRRLFG